MESMNEPGNMRREPRIVTLGVLLIALGAALLLDRLDIVWFRWSSLGWVAGACFGAFFAVDGFIRKGRGRIFWGSALFFVSLYGILDRWDVVYHHEFYTLPVLFLSLGLSFFVLFAYDPKETTLLVPGVFFCGAATLMVMWWWHLVEWYDVRHALRTYWPAVLVLWGVALLLRKRRPDRRSLRSTPADSTGSPPLESAKQV